MFELRMKRLLRAPLAALLLVIAPVVMSDGTGLMLGAGVYYSGMDSDISIEDLGSGALSDTKAFFDDHSIAYNLAGGWRFTKWLAVDVGYWDLGDFKSDELEDIDKLRTDTEAWTAGGILSVPVWLVDVYARAGVAMWDTDSRSIEDDGTDPYYGLGASLNLGGSLDLYIEWVRFDLELEVDTIGGGIRFTF